MRLSSARGRTALRPRSCSRAGLQVVVYEAQPSIGGGCRSDALTLPGFVHDVCSAVFPWIASPLFRSLPLRDHGLEWIEPPAMLVHPFDGDVPAAVVRRSSADTAIGLVPMRGISASPRSDRLILAAHRGCGARASLVPAPPLAAARFGVRALQPASRLASSYFSTERARALFGGIAAHGMIPLEKVPSGAVGLVLGALAHVVGWPIPRGGAQRLADSLASYFRALGGQILTSAPVNAIEELPAARAILCDLSPRPLLRIAGRALPDWHTSRNLSVIDTDRDLQG